MVCCEVEKWKWGGGRERIDKSTTKSACTAKRNSGERVWPEEN